MATNRKRKARAARLPLYESVKHYLLTGDYCCRELFPTDHRGRIEAFRLANPNIRDELRRVWLQHRGELLKEWKAEGREGLPWAETEFLTKENER